MSESRGQSLWPSHLGRQYAVQVGTAGGESGPAAAALYDGTLLLGGARGADGFIRFQSRDNAPLWDALFMAQPGGSCRVLGLGAFNPWTGHAERRLAFAAGSFVGTVDFLDMGPRSSAARVGFVARGEAFPSPGSPAMTGLAVFTSEGVNEALCVATGPACAAGSGDQKFGETQCFSSANLLGVGGYFTAATDFQEQQQLTPVGGEDGFLQLRQIVNEAFLAWRTIRIGGAGNDRVTGVAFDRKREGVVVTGCFSGAVDFNPDGAPAWRTSSGGTDLFVARYRPEAAVPNRLVLEWVYTLGGAGDDAGAGVAVDSGGNVYAAGRLRSTLGLDDVVVVRLDALSGSEAWVRQVQGPQNERATGVAVDGLDRALVCGWFECTTLAEGMSRGTSSATSTPYCLVDFDPGPGQDWRSSAGGKDAFLLRLRPDGSYDGCRTWGGAQDDAAHAVGADALSWGSVAVGGTFGDAGAPPGYSMTLDPSNPPLVLTGAGNSDAYLFALEPVPGSAPLKAQLTLVLDNSGSVGPTEAAAMCIGLADALVAFDPLFPNNPPIVRRDKSAAINVILHSVGAQPTGGESASLVPWTVVDQNTLPLLGQRLRNLVRPAPADNVFAPALNLARARLVGSRFNNPAVYQTPLLLADGLPNDDPPSLSYARSAALTGAFDQINTLVVFDGDSEPAWTRQWALITLTASVWTPLIVAPGEAPPPPNENNLGWAARVPMDPSLQTGWFSNDYGTVVGINLARSTRCPGDFDRNGVRDGSDTALFDLWWPSPVPGLQLRADLNLGWWRVRNRPVADDYDLDNQKLRTERAVPCP